jgi:glycosyltransferase involved in cell wall biosynthesis
MHILLIHQAFVALDEAGGTRHYELAQSLVHEGHCVTIIASPISYLTGKSRLNGGHWVIKEEPQPGITILRAYTYSALHRSFFHRVLSFLSFMVSSFIIGLQVKNVQLVWGTSPPIFQGATAWLLARLKRVPFLFEIRDLWPAFAIAVGVLKNPFLIKASLWLEAFLYKHADQVMVNSPGFINHVTSRGAKQVKLIPNGADPDMFDPEVDGGVYRQKHGLTDQFVILYAGAHGLSNDLNIVLEAAKEIRHRPDVLFLMVGDGKEKAALQKRAQDLNLSNVLFLPPVPKNEMVEVMAASNACLAILKPLELYKTTYPNKVFDYMAAARPVLLAIDGVSRQVVEEAQAGVFCQPGDPHALAETALYLADHPQQAVVMGKKGRQAIESKFNRAVFAKQLLDLLLSMEKK